MCHQSVKSQPTVNCSTVVYVYVMVSYSRNDMKAAVSQCQLHFYSVAWIYHWAANFHLNNSG